MPEYVNIILKNVKLSKDGAIYFIIERIATFMYDKTELKYFRIALIDSVTPTPQQIVSCLNGRGFETDKCVRGVFNDNRELEIEFSHLLFLSEYRIYYVVANDFPLRPIVDS